MLTVLSWTLILVVIFIAISFLVWISEDTGPKVVGLAFVVFLFWLIQGHIDEFISLAKFCGYGLIIIIIVSLIYKAICLVARSVLSSSENYRQAKSDDYLRRTEEELVQKLNETAAKKDIGHITMSQMQRIFSQYANKSYPLNRSFNDIASKFVNDCECQNFTNNKTWAEPYVRYIVEMKIRSLQQLLQEVDGPLKRFMHFTSDETLLVQALDKYCQRKGVDIPAILMKTTINGIIVYQPTEYGIRLYNKELERSESEEIDFDNL